MASRNDYRRANTLLIFKHNQPHLCSLFISLLGILMVLMSVYLSQINFLKELSSVPDIYFNLWLALTFVNVVESYSWVVSSEKADNQKLSPFLRIP